MPESSNTSESVSRETQAPFGDEYTDIILRTSDEIDIKFFRSTLCLASPVLRDKIRAQDQGVSDGRLHVIQVEAKSSILVSLLRLLCPISDDNQYLIDDLRELLKCTIMYRIDTVKSLMRKKLMNKFLNTDPLGVFVAACVCGLEDEAKKAAHKIQEKKIDTLDSEYSGLTHISASHYLRLLRYIRESAEPPRWTAESSTAVSTTAPEIQPLEAASSPFDGSTPWDTVIVSSDNVRFHVLRSILSVASGFFRDMFSLPQSAQDEPSSRTVQFSENGRVLDQLLRVCYPVRDPAVDSVEAVGTLLGVADKYEMNDVTMWAKDKLRSFHDKEPLHVYLLACHLGLKEEAVAAAKATLKFPEPSLEEMSEVPAFGYLSAPPARALLSYHRKCRQLEAWRSLTTSFQWIPYEDTYYTPFHGAPGQYYNHYHGGNRTNIMLDGGWINVSPAWNQYFGRARTILQTCPGNVDAAATRYWYDSSFGDVIRDLNAVAALFRKKIHEAIDTVSVCISSLLSAEETVSMHRFRLRYLWLDMLGGVV
jgi:hypothetical protein